MSYRFLEDVAIADVAFEASGKTLASLFSSAASALTNTMVKDLNAVAPRAARSIRVEAEDPEILLYRFLQELVYFKDAELLLFSEFDVSIREEAGKWRLKADVRGEELSAEKHQPASDVKAVSLHNFRVRKTTDGWRADVILDV